MHIVDSLRAERGQWKRVLACVCVALTMLQARSLIAQAGGGVTGSPPKFQLVRSVSGTKGSQSNGRYVIEDPRSLFYLQSDKQIIVYFEWQGPVGNHHYEGFWKNPEGKAVVFSDFSYVADQPRFGAYWILTLTDGTVPGNWSLEAHVDGEMTGVHTFQIIAASKPPSTAPERKLLSASEIYQNASQATVVVEKLRSSGETIAKGSGFLMENGLIVTTFQVIDGADLVLIRLPDGEKFQVSGALAGNRWQDWAVLKLPEGKNRMTLKPASKDSWQIGDRCFYLDVHENARTIVDGNVTGRAQYPNAGERLSISTPSSREAIGSPLLNEYGEVIGVVGAGVIPGTSSLYVEHMQYGYLRLNLSMANLSSTDMALPINFVSLPAANAAAESFTDLAQNGQFVPPLVGYENVARADLALSLENRSGDSPMPRDERNEFTRMDHKCVVFIMWEAKQKIHAAITMRIYDLNNHLLSESKQSKLNLSPGHVANVAWDVNLEAMKPGLYRIDVNLDEQPAWRTFFKIGD